MNNKILAYTKVLSQRLPITENTTETELMANTPNYSAFGTIQYFNQKIKPLTEIADINLPDLQDESSAVQTVKDWLTKHQLNQSTNGDAFISKLGVTFAHLKDRQTRGQIYIMNGTFAPIHYGHLGLPLGALWHKLSTTTSLDKPLSRILIIQGGDTPHKPYALAEKHRLSLAKLTCTNNPMFCASSIRGVMREALKELGVIINNEKATAAYSDMAAFIYIIEQNPSLELIWCSGADKLNGYPKEEHLVKSVLINILGVKSLYYAERHDEKANIFNPETAIPEWLSQVINNNVFVKLPFPTYPVSSTIIRNGLMENSDISDFMAPLAVTYIKENELLAAFNLARIERQITKIFSELGLKCGDKIEGYEHALTEVSDKDKKIILASLIKQMKELYSLCKEKKLI